MGAKKGTAFSVVPKTNRGKKMRGEFVNTAFSGAQKRAQLLRNPCILGERQSKGEQNQNWLPHPYVIGAQKRAELLRYSCIPGGPQAKGNKIRSGYLTPAL